MAGYARKVPPLVTQDPTRFTCWAAAAASWVAATPRSPASWWLKSQDDAIQQYSMFCDSRGGLDVKQGLLWLAAGVGMDLAVYKKAKQLDGAFLYWKLVTKGHLFLMFAGGSTGLGNTLGHAVVVYKVSSGAQGYSLGYMDPWPGMGYRKLSLSRFQAANEAVVGWPE